MTQIIDRRINGKHKSAVNRQRFLRRFKDQIRKAVSDSVDTRSITEIDSGEKINIPTKDTHEPVFNHGPGGKRDAIHPGNKDFITGDHVARPPKGGGGSGSEASDQGEGEDEFTFQLSREEFLEFFFEDLELPDLIKTQLATVDDFKSVRAGFSTTGVPTNIDIVRSLKGALARRIALRTPFSRELHECEDELEALKATPDDEFKAKRILELENNVRRLKDRIATVPFIDTFDLRYRNRIMEPSPTTQAVMFCLMDVSGSMDEARKEMAKRFFILLYLFLNRTYENIEVVFIRHHTTAKEVDEQDFFYSRETGGTVVSSALELMHKIICDRFPTSDWNIYAAQASDGDNWEGDSPNCKSLLNDRIMPLLQYFAYLEIMPHNHQSLWHHYEEIMSQHRNFDMQSIDNANEIYPVFRKLFARKHV
ncbi:MAG: YeaH/YhbH family protein [Ectothiorhodospiraceae bacterium]|nr:YeaH/YhbH family protein [Ectothiorhodospiraceae bacterium]